MRAALRFVLRTSLPLASAAALLSACASLGPSEIEILEPIGPAPIVTLAAPAQGYLRVYTPTEQYNDSDVHYYVHVAYRIYSQSGDVAQFVRNAESERDEHPSQIALPVGPYRIRAPTRRSGIATIPVVIQVGRTTEVFLDGSFEAPADAGDSTVRLPSGEAIGWSAEASRKP